MIITDIAKKVLRNSGGFFLFLLLAAGCASEKKEAKNAGAVEAAAPPSFEKGKITEVEVRGHAGESYALYVPSAYTKEKKYAAIFFFDPHAEGSLPLEKYKALADKYDIILAGSNNAKNGLAPETTLAFAQHIIQQVKQDLSIDERAVFTGGFSGGARVAASVAMMNQDIKGVIGCSAGFPVQNDSLPFVFAGVTADEDMNYLEMQRLELQLDKNPGEHVLIEGKGKHEWPDTTAMEDAMLFVLFRTLKADAKKEWIQEFRNEKEVALFKHGVIKTYRYEELQVLYLEGIVIITNNKKGLEQLNDYKEIKQWKAQRLAAFDQEEKLQRAYSEAMLSQPLDWWAIAAKRLSEGKAETNDLAMSHRILNYLSLQSYMYVNRAMSQGDGKATAHFLSIYSMVDPANPEWAYLYAIVHTASGENEKALQSLEKSASLGFNDVNRIENEAVFVLFKNDERFKTIVDKVRGNN